MDEETDTITKENVYDCFEKRRHPLYKIVSRYYKKYHSLLETKYDSYAGTK